MDGDGAMSALDEQRRGFGYGYRMTCECGDTSAISAADYQAAASVDARMPCDHCARTIHFGPAVAALWDPNDPALDNTRINQLAWYHTSTQADWPLDDYVNTQKATLLAGADRILADGLNGHLKRQLEQTLHVGGYEAAIENMLRRMCDQDDATAHFYLHRIALAVDPHRINNGYRDENHEPAAQLTTTDLRDAGLDAVRYLNVHESTGSLSLAVLPEAIAWVQTISVPANALAPTHPDSLLRLIAHHQGALEDLRASVPDASAIEPHRLRMMQLGAAPDPDGIGAATAKHQNQVYEVWDTVTTALVKYYLAGISPVVAERFEEAMSTWRRHQPSPTIHEFADFFAANAVSLTRPDAVTELLGTQDPRATTSTRSTPTE